jgi:uncharacterized repeat protein (TIGR02543 family)
MLVNKQKKTACLIFLFTLIIVSAALFSACRKNQQPGSTVQVPPAPLQSHMVTFNSNGGSIVSSQTISSGTPAFIPHFPIRGGFAFGGWYYDNTTFTKLHDFSQPVTGNISLFAKWSELSPEMIRVPGGSFEMGSDDLRDLSARPRRRVTVSEFYMAKYLITQAQYVAVTGYNPSEFVYNQEAFNCPVEYISWFDALEFCNKLSVIEGLTPVYTISNRTPASGYPITDAEISVNWSASGYRLPTEAEWEYAAKGGPGLGPYYTFSGSNDADAVAWYNFGSASLPTTHPVGRKQANGLGIFDMSGNVWEWCWDWFDDYPERPETNPRGPDSGSGRVKRGGCWSLSTNVIRVAYRNFYIPSLSHSLLGIRLVRGVN